MKEIKISVIGLGYVGLPVAIAFAKKYKVTGFDINNQRVIELNKYNDVTLEVSENSLRETLTNNLKITDEVRNIKESNIYIITVPTPIQKDKSPDLRPLLSASKMVGEVLSKGDIVIYESTVYPGCTEEECVPVLEKFSGLSFNTDFYCGYSPERINPGDKQHTIEKIIKVTSGSTPKIADKIDDLYSSIIKAGTHKAPTIKVAEAAKVIENAQRDINIAFVNELAKIFSIMDVDTTEVLNAASTKWNFLNFRPGLVGGHCIGVDPYYLADKSQKMGYTPKIILAGREVNDSMGLHIVSEITRLLVSVYGNLDNKNILILGSTFKENCPDFRNTKVVDIIYNLKLQNFNVDVFDPWVDKIDFKKEYNQEVFSEIPQKKYNAIILAVAHDTFKKIDLNDLMLDSNTVIYDIKSFYSKNLITKRL
tara:strand:- start:630 stop:1898 length:1269 start_codon:yes stop_codon:yes gene_type:complete